MCRQCFCTVYYMYGVVVLCTTLELVQLYSRVVFNFHFQAKAGLSRPASYSSQKSRERW